MESSFPAQTMTGRKPGQSPPVEREHGLTATVREGPPRDEDHAPRAGSTLPLAPRPTLGAESAVTFGRYTLHGKIAAGGMATVYFGRFTGPVCFSRVVAVKRMHPELARDPELVMMFLDEASLAARVQHPNVVATLDVVAEAGEIFIVMEYVNGASLARLARGAARRGERVPVAVAASILVGTLEGLHAAHEARHESGSLLGIVHRDVSPQNVLVGVDGLARIVDFGVAKATIRLRTTGRHEIRGKISYMAPEQLLPERSSSVDRRADVFSAGVVLWELLAGTRLRGMDDPIEAITAILGGEIPPLDRPDLPAGLEAVVRRALERDPEARFQTCEAFAQAIERVVGPLASARAVSAWMRSLANELIARRRELLLQMESLASESANDVARASVPGLELGASAAGQPPSNRSAPSRASIPALEIAAVATPSLSPAAEANARRLIAPTITEPSRSSWRGLEPLFAVLAVAIGMLGAALSSQHGSPSAPKRAASMSTPDTSGVRPGGGSVDTPTRSEVEPVSAAMGPSITRAAALDERPASIGTPPPPNRRAAEKRALGGTRTKYVPAAP